MQSNQVNLNLLLRRNWQKIEALQINLRHLNSVRFHMKESFGHRMAKCMLCHLLWQKGHFFVTEHPINGSVGSPIYAKEASIPYSDEKNIFFRYRV